jgi:dienelactone hydrolase
MLRFPIIAALAWTLLAGSSAADVDRLAGGWRGEATLAGDATPIVVELAACTEGLCGRLSMPELGYARLPLGVVTEEAGEMHAGPLTLTAEGQLHVGTLAGHGGGIFIDAMAHGDGEAQVTLARGAAPRNEFAEEEVTFHNGEVSLAGTLVRPRGRGRHPAILAVLGSGDAVRWYSLARAREWARLGYAVLVYDKRGSGASTGDWTSASLDDLADDAIAGVRYLQSHADIRADRVGMWTHSQGGWVAPRAIARGAGVAFLVAVSGGGATPLQVEHFGYDGALNRMEVEGAERERANALVERYFSYLGGDIDLAALRTALDDARPASWYRGLGISRVLPSEDDRVHWQWVARYDPADDIAALRIPTFVALAGGDDSTPFADTTVAWTRALGRAPQSRAIIRVYPGADHHMRIGASGWRRVSASYAADIERFLIQNRE